MFITMPLPRAFAIVVMIAALCSHAMPLYSAVDGDLEEVSTATSTDTLTIEISADDTQL